MTKSFIEAVIPHIKGKVVEIYSGNSCKERKYSDFSLYQKEVIRGVVKDGQGDLLILEVYDDSNNSNEVYINGYSIISIIEPKNKISIVDIYVDEHQKQLK